VNAVNVVDIERSLRLLVSPGATFEIRALGTERGRMVTLSGYFTDPARATQEISHTCKNMIGVYTTLNPVRPELLARRAHRIAPVLEKNTTTSDTHILRRTRLLIDIDGVPVAGISASDQEHQAAIDLASEIEDELARRGWPRPLRGDSGNGAHLDYAIDLPAEDEGLVERVLHAAQARFGCTVGDVTLKIDTTNKNPARITKIFGTPARKGDNLPERPHRLSRILAAPDELEPVTRAQLEAFVAEFAPVQQPAAKRAPSSSSNPTTLDVRDWLSKHGLEVKGESPWRGGTMYELAVCPQNPDHNRGEAHVEQHASGAISAGCHHESCKWDWAWLREQHDPKPARSARDTRDELKDRRERKKKPVDTSDLGGDGNHAGLGPRGGYRLTDLGNARRFADANQHRLRFVRAWNQWLVWDGRRWNRDELGAQHVAAKQVVAAIYADASAVARAAAVAVNSGTTTQEGSALEDLTKHARDTAKRSRLEAMIALAESEPELAASSKIWDADPWLLNVANGTVDLRTGEIRPHRQSDLITMIAPVDYDPLAKAPRFEQFIARVQPDPEIRAWIQRYLGYALTGDVREQCLAFCFGGGSNGKSVLLDVVLNVIGGYGLRAAADLVLAKHGEAHPTERADLEGKRLVVCSEIEQGRTWAEALIKRITGDQSITARRMRQDFYTFPATHKLIVAANTRPVVRGTDHGIWRRMRLIPWLVKIPDEEQDKTLPQQLLEQEAPGILAWLVRGCLAWQNRGIGSTASIDLATSEYRADQDVLGRWIEDRCDLVPGGWHATKSLYESFVEWCKEEGMQPWVRRTWRERMLERDGITDGVREHGTLRVLVGIQLRGTWA
jgi:putative DNA primase/helicase